MYTFLVSLLTFYSIINTGFAFETEDFNLFNVNYDDENYLFPDPTIPTNEEVGVIPDEIPFSLDPNLDLDLGNANEDDFLIASKDDCLSSSSSDILSSSSIFRTTRSLRSRNNDGVCSSSDDPAAVAAAAELGIEDDVIEKWCPAALLVQVSLLYGGLPIIPVCWTPATVMMPSNYGREVFITGWDGKMTWIRDLTDCTLRKLLLPAFRSPRSFFLFFFLEFMFLFMLMMDSLKEISKYWIHVAN